VSDDKNPLEQAVDQALDAFVYAPIGLLFEGPELFPKLVEKGRTQVQVARMMGQMVVQMGQSEAGKRIAGAEGPLRDAFVAMGVVPRRAPAPAPAPAPATSAAPRQTAATRVAPEVSTLGITDYDSLSASQVVKRLRGMSDADLDAIAAYEGATRARKTILNRITQLRKA
jgi:hypothetical protein